MSDLNQDTNVQGGTDLQIENLLQEAYFSSVRKTHEYLFGRLEERFETEKELFKKSFEKIIGIADAFFELVKKIFPQVEIRQFRIGIDYSSRLPAALMLIGSKNQKELVEIRTLARKIEKKSWGYGISDGYLWTKIDRNIEQELLETDFPFFRKNI